MGEGEAVEVRGREPRRVDLDDASGEGLEGGAVVDRRLDDEDPFVFRLDAVALKLSIAREMPAVHNMTANKLRELMKPDLEEICFFIDGLVLFAFALYH